MLRNLKRLLGSSISIRLFSVALGFISSVLVNRVLGLELRGAYTTIYTYANLLQTLLNFGIAYALVPLGKLIGQSRAKDAVNTCLWLQFTVCVLCSIGFLCISFSIQNLFIAILMCLQILNSQIVFVALIVDMRSRNMTLLFTSALYVFANLILTLFLQKQLYVVLALLAIKNLLEIIVCSHRQKLFHFKLSDLSFDIIKEIAKYGIPTAVLAFLITCNYNIDVVVLNYLNAGDYELGLFGVAYTLSNMLWFIPDAFKEYVYNKSAREDPGGMTLVLIFFNVCICICICIGFFFLGKPFLSLMYGKEFVAAFPTTVTIFIGIIPMIAFKLIHPIYVNEGKSLTVAAILLIAVASNSLCAFVLVPLCGAFGAAIATVIAYFICGILFFIKYIYDYRLSYSDFKCCLEEMLRMDSA